MTPQQISTLSDEELAQQLITAKKYKPIHAFLIGFSFAVLMVSVYFKGIGFSSIIPFGVFLFFLKIGIRHDKWQKELKKETEARNLN
jgi:hypothetical protein